MRKHEYIINLGGNLRRRARAYQQSVERFADKSSARLQRLQHATATTTRRLERMGTVAGVAGGATLMAAGKGVADLDDRINRLGIDFNLAGSELKKFKADAKDTILSTAIDYSVASDEIMSGIEAIAQKTGDLDFANKNIEVLARTLSATDAQGDAMGGLLSEIGKMGIQDPAQVQEILDVMIVQGKNGAFTLKDLSAQGERVFAAYGPKNLQQVREMGAALQVIRASTGGSEQAVTAFEALLRTLRDGKKAKLLQDNGLQVFDPEKLKDGVEQLRPINEIMTELVQKANGKTSILSKALGDSEAVKALMGLVNELNSTGDVGVNMERILNVQANDQASKDSEEAQGSLKKEIQRVRNVLERYANTILAPLIAELADMLDRVEPEHITTFLNAVKYAAGGLVAFAVAAKSAKAGMALLSVAKNVAGKGGLLAPGATPARPIFAVVLNNGMGLGKFGKNGKGLGKTAQGGKLNKLKSLGKGVASKGKALGAVALTVARSSAGMVGLSGTAGYMAGGQLYKHGLAGNAVGDAEGSGIAHVLAFFGSKQAKESIEAEKRLRLQEQQYQLLMKQFYAAKQQYQNRLDVKVKIEDGRVVVENVASTADNTDMTTSYTLGDL